MNKLAYFSSHQLFLFLVLTSCTFCRPYPIVTVKLDILGRLCDDDDDDNSAEMKIVGQAAKRPRLQTTLEKLIGEKSHLEKTKWQRKEQK